MPEEIKYKGIPEEIMSISEDPLDEETFLQYTINDKKVVISKKHREMYQRAADRDRSFDDRLRNFFRAENDLGRWAKVIKDFGLLFAPQWVNIGYNTVDDFILNQVFNDMTQDTENKSTTRSSQIITFGILFLAGLLMQFGIIPPEMIELSPDAQWVTTISGLAGIIFRLITDRPVKLGKALRRTLGRKE